MQFNTIYNKYNFSPNHLVIFFVFMYTFILLKKTKNIFKNKIIPQQID